MKVNRILFLVVLVGTAGCSRSVEFEQYYNQGEVLYTKHCSNCHQKDGKGLGLLYPPLDKSDFMDQNFEQVLCIMRHGKSTPTVVNGKTYQQPMEGVSSLTDIDIAEIATYIYNTWDHKRGIIKVNDVAGKMAQCEE